MFRGATARRVTSELPAAHADTAEELVKHLTWALAEPGPHLIEAVVPPSSEDPGLNRDGHRPSAAAVRAIRAADERPA